MTLPARLLSKLCRTENRQFHFMVEFTMPRCKQYVADCHHSASYVVTCDVIAGIIKFSHQKKIHVTCAKLIACKKKKKTFLRSSNVPRRDTPARPYRYKNHKPNILWHRRIKLSLVVSINLWSFSLRTIPISCCAMFVWWNSRHIFVQVLRSNVRYILSN